MSVITPQAVLDAIDRASQIAGEPQTGLWSFPSPLDRVKNALKPATDYIRLQLNDETVIHPHACPMEVVVEVRYRITGAANPPKPPIPNAGVNKIGKL